MTTKPIEVDKLYYQDFGTRYKISFRTLLIQPVSIDQDVYLNEEMARKLRDELNRVLGCK